MDFSKECQSVDKESYPELTKLLSKLSTVIDEDGCSKSLRSEVNEAKATLDHEKLKWLRTHTLYTEVQNLLLEEQARTVSTGTPTSQGQFFRAAGDCLTYAVIGDFINCHPDPASQTTLLGLGKDTVHTKNPYHKHVSSIKEKLVPEIENRLKERCDQLLDFRNSSTHIKPRGDGLSQAACSQLPVVLSSERAQIEEQERLLKQEKQRHNRQFWQYYQALVSSLEMLKRLISRHRLESQSQCDQTTTKWLSARCDAMCLKINMLELQIMCDTYHAATVQALTKIRNQLDMALLETQHDLSRTTYALRAYQAVGMGFDTLVQDYTQLRDELENKKWAVRQLRETTMPSPGGSLGALSDP